MALGALAARGALGAGALAALGALAVLGLQEVVPPQAGAGGSGSQCGWALGALGRRLLSLTALGAVTVGPWLVCREPLMSGDVRRAGLRGN